MKSLVRSAALAAAMLFGTTFAVSSAHAQSAQTAPRPSAPRPNAPPASASANTAAPEGVVNINRAGEEELVRVPGIGPSRAAAILALRQRMTQFRAVDDLLRVRGIGRVSLRHMRPFLTLTGETTLAERPGRHRPSADDAAN